MKPIRLLIVDDEPLAHKVLEGYCRSLKSVTVVGNCYDGVSTINFLNDHAVDALLLDIQMPDLNGLELLDSLQTQCPKVILTTAYTEFALQGFDYDQVIDYLHKPIRLTRFIRAIDRLRRQLTLETAPATAPKGMPSQEPTVEEFVSISDNRLVHKIRISDIFYLQSWGNYLKVFLRDGDTKIIRRTIKSLTSELAPNGFVRIHKSYSVNSREVRTLEGNQVRLSNDTLLPIGKSYTAAVKSRLV
jgi:DNA-binding LytR/AlgR family response regulator